METKYTLKQPTRGVANAGMKTPFDQGYEDGSCGRPYENPYDQPGEKTEAREFRNGWKCGESEGMRG